MSQPPSPPDRPPGEPVPALPAEDPPFATVAPNTPSQPQYPPHQQWQTPPLPQPSYPAMSPLPVHPLPYTAPIARRPGIITAIGVVSIIVGSLTLLSTFVQGVQILVMVAVTNTSAAISRAAVSAQQQAAQAALVEVPEDGIDRLVDRQMIIGGLGRARPLPMDRRKQLDELLRVGGKRIIVLKGAQLTPKSIRANVSDSGRQYADDGNGADYFIVGLGKIEVYDDHAVFYPNDGSDMIGASVAGPDLAQATTGEDEESADAPTGQSSTADPSTAVTPALPPATMPIMPSPTFDRSAIVILMIERLLSFGLAIFIVVSGIMVLRQSPRGRKLHWIYAFAKIPLALLGGWATLRLWSSFFNTMPSGGGSIASMWTPWVILLIALACAYPIALLMVLRSRSVREYYNSTNV